jgi:hypothetical protein
MAKRLNENITSRYFEAANGLGSKKARRKIIAYVESYDDVFFWRTILGNYEDDSRYFEVMLPTRMNRLERGKKAAIANIIDGVGQNMIACVDADYDYLIQGASPASRTLLTNRYIFHTYAYAIENLQCYAPSLHNVAVAVVLNDHSIFDFNEFMTRYSEIIYPLFVWNIWYYRSEHYNEFTITDFDNIIELGDVKIDNPEYSLDKLHKKVSRAVDNFKKKNTNARDSYLAVKDDLNRLGVDSSNTYLYIQGHHLFDHVVVPVMDKVCGRLYREREQEIGEQSVHNMQYQTEISSYKNSVGDITAMLKKNMGYAMSPQFKNIMNDVAEFLDAK